MLLCYEYLQFDTGSNGTCRIGDNDYGYLMSLVINETDTPCKPKSK